MYETFYGFNENPFQDIPDPDFLFAGKLHTIALSQLEYSLTSQIGFSVITGDPGSGKTILIRSLLNHATEHIKYGLISSAHQPTGNITKWILAAFGLQPNNNEKSILQKLFTDFLISQYAQGNRCVLIIDEAQELSAEYLEELRILSNINADKDQIFQVILVGQNELRNTLRHPDMQQFAQRVAIDYHLKPLTLNETTSYIHHRCKIAGCDKPLFNKESCQQIFSASQGIPRLINTLCNTALIYGYAAQALAIESDLIQEVIHDKQIGGLSGLQSEHAASTPTSTNKGNLPCAAISSDNPLFTDNIRSLLVNFDVNIISTTTPDKIQTNEFPSADVLILESNSPAPKIQTLVQKWQRPILFLDTMKPYKDLGKTERFSLSQSLHKKLLSLLATQESAI